MSIFRGGVTNELVHTDKGEDTYRFLSQFNRIYLAGYVKLKRSHLDKHRDALIGYGLKWSCPEEIVLFNGTEISANINDCLLPAMPKGNCFANAFRLALTDPTLRYHEGWACMEGSIPTHHGWVVDAQGRVQDPTWLSVIRDPRDPSKIPAHNTNRCVYMGVHVPLDRHIAWFLDHHDVNLLARGDFVPPGLLENGMALFDSYDTGEGVTEDTRRIVIKVLDEASAWCLDEATGIFHRDGQRWCGRRERYLEDGEA